MRPTPEAPTLRATASVVQFSGADLFLAPILDYVQAFPEGGQLMARYPNLVRGQALIRERANFAATNPQA